MPCCPNRRTLVTSPPHARHPRSLSLSFERGKKRGETKEKRGKIRYFKRAERGLAKTREKGCGGGRELQMYGGNLSPRRRRKREVEPPAGVPPRRVLRPHARARERRRGGCRCTSGDGGEPVRAGPVRLPASSIRPRVDEQRRALGGPGGASRAVGGEFGESVLLLHA